MRLRRNRRAITPWAISVVSALAASANAILLRLFHDFSGQLSGDQNTLLSVAFKLYVALIVASLIWLILRSPLIAYALALGHIGVTLLAVSTMWLIAIDRLQNAMHWVSMMAVALMATLSTSYHAGVLRSQGDDQGR